jgi:hypothetical protein
MASDQIERFAAAFPNYINDSGDPFDNIYSKAAITGYLMAKDKLDGDEDSIKRVRTVKGGTSIEIPLEYATETGNMQYFTGITPINFTKVETIKNAEYTWANLAHTLLIDKKDILDIAGNPAKIDDFAKVKRKGLWKSLKQQLNTDLLATSNPTNGFNAIPVLVVKDNTSGTVGGLSRSTYSWWRNKVKASTTDATSTFTQLRREIRNLVNTCAYNAANDAPDLGITDQTVYEYLQAYWEEKGQHTFNNKAMAELMKVPKILHFEGMDIIWDTNVPNMNGSGSYSSFFALNTDYLYFVACEGRNFEISDPIDMMKSKGQDAIGYVVLLRGQMCCSNMSKQGLLYKINQSITSLS